MWFVRGSNRIGREWSEGGKNYFGLRGQEVLSRCLMTALPKNPLGGGGSACRWVLGARNQMIWGGLGTAWGCEGKGISSHPSAVHCTMETSRGCSENVCFHPLRGDQRQVIQGWIKYRMHLALCAMAQGGRNVSLGGTYQRYL
ncbi:uncharacterized protein LY79DRAFT_32744 [Colletotrichum navitas]|uniref:Uncharacterized protein n=1 Tax=Colletotrichum navitas TaxID=681940 RepID=A0AAD8Q6I2_9PEZI|nr:uncharacterized protein LY79DRAFT_32744 [Colletotrichum navitas]KAK1596835.1 hypothetical protein LY79DRAFT_32744 [Colletotrichum navitas]